MVNLLFTGVTGYIGSSVVSAFLDHPDRANFTITAVVRNAEKAEKLKAYGINAVVGDHTDAAFFEKLAFEADYYFSIADADNVAVAKTALTGLKKRYEATGVKPAFIHVSGTGVLADDAKGEYSDNIYYDNDTEKIETLPDEQLHRDLELLLVGADKEGYVNSYIISPCTIWGQPQHKLAKSGLVHTFSIQVPALIKVALARGAGGYAGKGENVWDNVNIDDLGNFYIKFFDYIRATPSAGHGRTGFYFVVADEHRLKAVGDAISKALFEIGKINSPVATQFKQEELDQFFGGFQRYFSCNARARGPQARATGWAPTKTTEDFIASIKPEAEAIVATL